MRRRASGFDAFASFAGKVFVDEVLSISFCLFYFDFLDNECIFLGCVRLVSRNLSCSRRNKCVKLTAVVCRIISRLLKYNLRFYFENQYRCIVLR